MAKEQSTTRRLLKLIGLLILVLIVLGVIGAVTGMFGGGGGALAVETAEAKERTLTQTVTAFGRVQPMVELTITSDVSGEIIELHVEEGDEVEKGEPLAVIDAEEYQAKVERAEASVKQAKANRAQRKADLLQAEATYERKQKLFEQKAISESALQKAQTAYKVAQSAYEAAQYRVEIAKAKLSEASDNLSETRIYAPMSGTITRLTVEEGERVVGTSLRPGTVMMHVARLDQMEIEVDVNENDIVNISLHDTARVEIDAYPERTFRAVVTQIANSARIEAEGTQQQVTNFPVTLHLLLHPERKSENEAQGMRRSSEIPAAAASSPLLRPGMSGTVEIFTETVTDIVSVPIQAVTVRDLSRDTMQASGSHPATGSAEEEQLHEVVFVVDSAGKAQRVPVTTGIANDFYITVKNGLGAGQKVITGPYEAVSQKLEPGMAVTVE